LKPLPAPSLMSSTKTLLLSFIIVHTYMIYLNLWLLVLCLCAGLSLMLWLCATPSRCYLCWLVLACWLLSSVDRAFEPVESGGIHLYIQ
jgi:hypothetical protein